MPLIFDIWEINCLTNTTKRSKIMIQHTIIFTGKSGPFEDLRPDIINKKIAVPKGNVEIILPTDYDQRRFSDIIVKLSYSMPTQNIDWLSDVDLSKYKIQDIYCCFSEEGHENLYQCVYSLGRPCSGQPTNVAPAIFKEIN